MIGTIQLRQATPDDRPVIRDLVTRAFGRPDEAAVIDRLEADGDAWLQVVASQEGQVIGQAMFFTLPVRGRLGALGLGPMAVDPWVQKQGVGRSMIRYGLETCLRADVPIVFVLGHAGYYPKAGFTQEAAAAFRSPWSGKPEFMAVRLIQGPPMSGDLVYPKAFGV